VALENLRSIFQDNIDSLADDYQSRQPQHRLDTRIGQQVGKHLDNPILDTLLRESPAFVSNDLLTKFYTEQNFDSRTPKNDGIQINNINSYKGSRFYPTNLNKIERYGAGEIFVTTDYIMDNGNPFTFPGQSGIGLYNKDNMSKNQSWDRLYNSNHSNKPYDQSSWQGITPQTYPNVNRDKLNIRKASSTQTVGEAILALSRNTLGSTQTEPYIISELPKFDNDYAGTGRFTNSGNRSISITRALTDTVRLGKYLTSPSGILFTFKQNLLPLFGEVQYRKDFDVPIVGKVATKVTAPQRYKSTIPTLGEIVSQYSPLSTLLAAGSRMTGAVPFLKVRRGWPYGPTMDDASYNYGSGLVHIDKTFTSFGLFGLKTKFPIAAGTEVGFREGRRFFNKFTGGADGPKDGDKFTNLGIGKAALGAPDLSLTKNFKTLAQSYPSTFNFPNGVEDIESEANGMPMYFKDLRNNAYIFFRAYIEGLTENVSPSWTPTNYIGRSEPVYTYERGERDITFTLKLVAQTRDELDLIYTKLGMLTSLCYPSYEKDKHLGKSLRMKPPLTKFRLGELYGNTDNEVIGFIKTLTYTIDQTSTWETERGARVPRNISATISYQVIHSKVPQLETGLGSQVIHQQFYGFKGEAGYND
jgi:hypothetical protein